MDDRDDTDVLREEQLRRFRRQRREAERSDDESEVAEHERRAQKAGYLADKLAERADSERGS